MNTNDIRAMVLSWFKWDQAKQELTQLNPSQQRRFNRVLKREMAVRESRANREEKVLEARRLRVEGKQAKQRESLIQQAKERQPKQESKTAPEFKSKQLELDFKKPDEPKVQANQNEPRIVPGMNLRIVLGINATTPTAGQLDLGLAVRDFEVDPTNWPDKGDTSLLDQLLPVNWLGVGPFPSLEVFIKNGLIWCVRGTNSFTNRASYTV